MFLMTIFNKFRKKKIVRCRYMIFETEKCLNIVKINEAYKQRLDVEHLLWKKHEHTCNTFQKSRISSANCRYWNSIDSCIAFYASTISRALSLLSPPLSLYHRVLYVLGVSASATRLRRRERNA